MIAGSNPKPVALPTIPEGYRWVIKPYVQYGDNYLRITLEERIELTYGWFVKKTRTEWKKVDSGSVDEDYAAPVYGTTLTDLVEAEAKKIKERHINKLEKAVAREALIGVYEA